MLEQVLVQICNLNLQQNPSTAMGTMTTPRHTEMMATHMETHTEAMAGIPTPVMCPTGAPGPSAANLVTADHSPDQDSFTMLLEHKSETARQQLLRSNLAEIFQNVKQSHMPETLIHFSARMSSQNSLLHGTPKVLSPKA